MQTERCISENSSSLSFEIAVNSLPRQLRILIKRKFLDYRYMYISDMQIWLPFKQALM